MIVVTVGTNEQPFDRLAQAAAALQTAESLLVQHGSSRVRPGAGRWVEFLAFEDLAAAVAEARIVVCHAGVGSIMLARRFGKVPLVMARRVAEHEAVDDHQVTLATRLAQAGWVRVVEDAGELAAALDQPPPADVRRGGIGSSSLAFDLASFLAGRRPEPAAAAAACPAPPDRARVVWR